MQFDDPYKYMISGYYGIDTLDEYDNKIYLLKEVEDYIKDYLKDNKIDGIDYDEIDEDIYKNTPLIHKLQDALLVLRDINAPLEVKIMVKQKIGDLKRNYKLNK